MYVSSFSDTFSTRRVFRRFLTSHADYFLVRSSNKNWRAVRRLNVLIDLHQNANGPDAVDFTPTLYLAVAHSRRPGYERLALVAFPEAYRGLSRPRPGGDIYFSPRQNTHLSPIKHD